MKSPQPTYRLTLKAMKHDVPVDSRLQRLVKAAKRAYGFRLVNIEEVGETVPVPSNKK